MSTEENKSIIRQYAEAARGALKVSPQANATRYMLTAVSPRGKARQSLLVYAKHGK